jgi:hypothetical protein
MAIPSALNGTVEKFDVVLVKMFFQDGNETPSKEKLAKNTNSNPVNKKQ